MNIDAFLAAVLSQNQVEMRKYFHRNASIRWHCTNEIFTVDEYIKVNCEYPGNWNGEIERQDKINDLIILVYRVSSADKSLSFHAICFIRVRDDLISEMDEYWADDNLPPEWRRKMKIGKHIR